LTKTIFERVYGLCVEGIPAIKISKILKRDKGRISRIINALIDLGFLVCVNPRDKVKFYEATTKFFSPDDVNAMSTILREKPRKISYGGYETRVHGISFKATIISWKKDVKWDNIWTTNGTRHFLLNFQEYTFIRHKSTRKDTLVIIIPDLLWNIRTKGSVNDAVKRKARVMLGEFASRYEIRLKGFMECSGTSYAIPVRSPELVKMAQKKTVYFENGAVLDASHGIPEFEAPLNVMQELLSLPDRVSTLEDSMATLMNMMSTVSQQMDSLSKQMSRMEQMFSQPKRPDERRDVT